MLNWVIIAVLILLIFTFLRFKHLKHKIFAILIILFVLFFYLSASRIISESNIDLASFDGIVKAVKIYFAWLVNAFENLRTVVGNAVKMDWKGNLTVGG